MEVGSIEDHTGGVVVRYSDERYFHLDSSRCQLLFMRFLSMLAYALLGLLSDWSAHFYDSITTDTQTFD